jgi:xylulokinase
MKYVIAYDFGTGGVKSSLFDERGVSIASDFKQCETYYPAPEFREQRPEDWWNMFRSGTRDLLLKTGIKTDDIAALACSGHSLGVVPLDKDGKLLAEYVPIWNDARAVEQAQKAFTILSEEDWYMKTGNGFPPPLYAAFKILWYKENKRELYESASAFIGTKDYLNYRLTGVIATDYSYASGSGVYDLRKCGYDREYIKILGLRESDFPPPVESSAIIGKIKPGIAAELGLPSNLPVAAGGVDNACMAAGAGCVSEGTAYTSLGTSAWTAVTSCTPVLNSKTRPYVFAHLIKGMYTSAESIFSAGNTHRWVRNVFCADLLEKEKSGGEDAYIVMDKLAGKSPLGANGLVFIPTLAGATGRDKSPNAKGAITGLDLRHTRGDIIRAAMEGICMGLKEALEELKKIVSLSNKMLIVGGGAKSAFWRQLFADIYGMDITESAVGENAGSLGAMACAAIGANLWKDFTPLAGLNKPISITECDRKNSEQYERIYRVFLKINEQQSEIADYKQNKASGQIFS